MDSGWKTQYLFHGRMAKEPTAPRLANVRRVLEAYGLYNKWIYQIQLEQLMRRHPATGQSNCWESIRIECRQLAGERKNSILRYVLELMGRPPDPALGVICVVGAPRIVDSRELMLDLDLGFGAHGGVIDTYPIEGLPHQWALVKVTNEPVLKKFASTQRTGTARTGTQYWVSAELHVDKYVGLNTFPTLEAQKLIESEPLKIRPVPGSNFVTDETIAEEKAWLQMITDLRKS